MQRYFGCDITYSTYSRVLAAGELSFWTLFEGSPKQDAAALRKSGIGPTTAMDLMDEADRQAYAIVEVHRGPGQFELVHANFLNS